MQTVCTCLRIDYRMEVKRVYIGKSPGEYYCILRFYIILDDVDDVAVVRKGTVVKNIIQCI